jgi:hypothetical protein
MAINPIVFTENVVKNFLRYQLQSGRQARFKNLLPLHLSFIWAKFMLDPQAKEHGEHFV